MASKHTVRSRFIERDLEANSDASGPQGEQGEKQQGEQQQDEWELSSDDENNSNTRPSSTAHLTKETIDEKYLNTNIETGLSDAEVKSRHKLFGKV
jgi:hypothetical protein